MIVVLLISGFIASIFIRIGIIGIKQKVIYRDLFKSFNWEYQPSVYGKDAIILGIIFLILGVMALGYVAMGILQYIVPNTI